MHFQNAFAAFHARRAVIHSLKSNYALELLPQRHQERERENDAENALLRPLLKYLSRLGSHSSCDISISIMSHPAHASIFSMPPQTFLMRQ